MKKEHPHAQIFRWIADGENVQARRVNGSEPWWSILEDASNNWLAALIQDRMHAEYEFRIKPKTITVGDREIEAPVMNGPGYYITAHGDVFRWFDETTLDVNKNLQKHGLVFATEEAARAAQEAITALLTKEPS